MGEVRCGDKKDFESLENNFDDKMSLLSRRASRTC
jgi:hypothetical protein